MSKPPRRPASVKVQIKEPDGPELQVQSSPPGDYVVLPSSNLTLLCSTGLVGTERVIVPYLQMELMATDPGAPPSNEEDLEVETAFRGTLGYENAAFLLMDLARDFRSSTRELAALSSGGLGVEPTRLAYAAQCIRRAKMFIDTTVADLEKLAPPPPPERKPAKAGSTARRTAVRRAAT